jgi:hypothetical protein
MLKLLLTDDNYLRPAYTPFLFFENVVDYNFIDYDKLEIIIDDEKPKHFSLENLPLNKEGKSFYVAIDSANHDTFGHWFYESLIFVASLPKNKIGDSTVNVLIKSEKKYKKKFLNHFELQSTITPDKNNIVGFPARFSSLNLNNHSHRFEVLMNKFHNLFVPENKIGQLKDINVLLLPRQKIDNFKAHDRIVDSSDIEKNISTLTNSLVLNTDQIDSVSGEFDLISRSRNIVVPDGSAFLVTGFMARDSNIIVLGNQLCPFSFLRFEKCRLIYEFIKRNNRIFFITGKNDVFLFSDVAPILEGKIVSY